MRNAAAETVSAEGWRVWHVPDCYLPATSTGKLPSHEAFCVLNVSPDDASMRLTFYFADRDPVSSEVTVPARRNVHLRTDQPEMVGAHVPPDVPYACRIESSVPITVQYSRLDTQDGYALTTTSAIPIA